MSTDRFTIRAVVILLGAVALSMTATLGLVALRGVTVDSTVLTLLATQLGTSVGALGALLAQTSSPRDHGADEEVPVEVEHVVEE